MSKKHVLLSEFFLRSVTIVPKKNKENESECEHSEGRNCAVFTTYFNI